MERNLKKAGVPNTVCALIPEIVGTCASCRAWSLPPQASVASVELADTFNQQLEADLMFVYHYIIFHTIDRCTRWHVACIVQSKADHVLLDALNSI